MNTGFAYLSCASLTDVGRRRKNNEDALLCLADSGVFCVADGMGGIQGGEVASQAVVDALRQIFSEAPEAPYAVTAWASARLAERALNQASRWIKERAGELGLTGTGSTAVALAFDRVTPAQAVVLNVGDSRAYRYRGDKLVQLSADHSVAAAAGLPDDKNLPVMFRGVITRAVGLEPTVAMEKTPVDVAAGDLFLLCSDGLTKMVGDKALARLLKKNGGAAPEALARLLIDEALAAGGEDNVSVVVVRVAELPPAPTMAVPPQTLELEEEPAAPAPAGAPAPAVDERETGQTSQTGKTVDTAGFEKEGVTPPGAARATPPTPPQPLSGEGVTPPAAADGSAAAAARTGETVQAEAPAPGAAPRATPPRGFWLAVLVLAAAAAAAAAAAVHARRLRGLRNAWTPVD